MSAKPAGIQPPFRDRCVKAAGEPVVFPQARALFPFLEWLVVQLTTSVLLLRPVTYQLSITLLPRPSSAHIYMTT